MPNLSNSRLPADLRSIAGMTIAEVEEINALRRQRATIQTRLDNLPKKQSEYEEAIQKTKDGEAEIIAGARARTPASTPV